VGGGDTRLQLEHFANQMCGRSESGRREIELTGMLLEHRHKLRTDFTGKDGVTTRTL
jgi:hypothetical protein